MKITKLMLALSLCMFSFSGCSQETQDSMKKDVDNAAEKVNQATEEGVEKVKEATEEGVEKTKEAGEAVGEKMKEIGEDLGADTEEGADAAKEEINELDTDVESTQQ